MNEQDTCPILFTHYPELEAKISRIPLGSFPTPVHALNNLGVKNLWIKRDDLTSPLYGGNKVRKLEFIFGDVFAKKKKKVVTFGGIGTNHGLATAIFCHQLNLACTLILFKQPVTPNVKQNLLLFDKYNAEVLYKNSFLNTAVSYFILQRLADPFAYFLYPGGSTIEGTIGFVNAAFELKSQIDQGLMPEPEVLFCPVGSSGTMAGLLLGTKLAGLNTTVIGVRVTQSHLGPLHVCTSHTVQKLAKQTHAYLKKLSDRIPDVSIDMPILLGGYLGEGYGFPTKAGTDAIHAMKSKENLTLDPCYTSKAFAAVLDHCKSRSDDSKPALFWHTYNSVDLSGQAERVNVNHLPKKIQTFINQKEAGVDHTLHESASHMGGIMKDRLTLNATALDFTFNTPWKTSCQFYDFLENTRALLIFLRYIGCPLCQLKISEIIKEKALFDAEGLHVFVVLQSEPESIREVLDENSTPVTIICDPQEHIFRLYKVSPGSFFQYITPGVVMKAMKARKQGIKHGKREGRELQVPAVFVVDTDKRIRNVYYGKNIGDVPGNETLLEMSRR